MGSSIIALVGSFSSMVLSVLWLLLLLAPSTWFYLGNGIFKVKVSLVSMDFESSTVADIGIVGMRVVGADEKSKALHSLFNQEGFWIDEGVTTLCTPILEAAYQWCEPWKMAKFGSLTMLIFGLIAAICLAAGGVMGFYYNQVHSTKTGRVATVACYVAAEVFLFLGLLCYICLTMQAGEGANNRFVAILGDNQWMYMWGFGLACVLTVLSGVPLFLQVFYVKKWSDEWKGGGDDDMTGCEAGAYGSGGYGGYGTYGSGAPTAAGYGTAGYGTAGYGTAGYGTAGYGTAGQPPAVGYGYAPQQTPYPVPGSGRPAW